MWPQFYGAPTYGILYTLSAVVHGVGLFCVVKRFEMRRRDAVVLCILYVVAMSLGARFLYDSLNQRFELTNWTSLHYWTCADCWGLWGGPLVYLALSVIWVILKKNNANARDFAVAPLPLAMIVAKMACFANGCCYGTPSDLPWAITFPEGADAPPGVPIHPTQVYEILVLCLVIAVFARLDRQRWRGTWPAWFLAIYGTGRTLTEFWRPVEEQRFVIASLTTSQWLCAIASLIAIVWLLTRATSHGVVDTDADEFL